MDCKYVAESGLQLLARLDTRPNLSGLDANLFQDGPKSRDYIEISGESSSGKTFIITELIMKCILPKYWDGTHIGGFNSGAILIDTDHHFQLLKLVNLMETCLLNCIHRANEKGTSKVKPFNANTIETVIKESLGRFTILQCHDSMQFFVTIHSLQKILCDNSNIGLLVVDSLTAYYWQDVMTIGVCKMDTYIKKILKLVQKSILEFPITTIYSKQSCFQSKIKDTNSSTTSDLVNVKYKIHLSKIEASEGNSFIANVATQDCTFTKFYKLTPDGTTWSK